MFRVRSAKHIGRSHILNGTNCQDALTVLEGDGYIAGVICDGCSEGLHSEVGASLGSAYLINTIRYYRKNGASPLVTARAMDAELGTLFQLQLAPFTFAYPGEMVSYVKDHLLFTVVGFILTPHEAVVFFAGDGTLVIDDVVSNLHPGNTPSYPAYSLIPFALPAGYKPTPIEVWTFSAVRRLAIGSDAWKDEPDVVNRIWGHEHPAGLQRMINAMSRADHRFYDDVSIITVERL